jgi:hypothetical protein
MSSFKTDTLNCFFLRVLSYSVHFCRDALREYDNQTGGGIRANVVKFVDDTTSLFDLITPFVKSKRILF